MTVSFDDLISKQFLGKISIDVAGVGSIEIKQLSAKQASAIVEKSSDLTGDDLEFFVSEKALELVKGSPPLFDEVESFRNNLSAPAIAAIYRGGLEFNDPVVGDMEEAEKN